MRNQQGFTLVELMIVMEIVAILSAIGLPAYQNYRRRSPICCALQDRCQAVRDRARRSRAVLGRRERDTGGERLALYLRAERRDDAGLGQH